ncbi:MAG: shikimate kinase [Microscillaceae bacterium]|nr:shikimate kinase [Microscillaceae bacterium]
MKISLVGMPGSGKSTLGKYLSQKLGFTFIDLDAYIEQKEGKSIATLFAQHGEAYFRACESQYLREVLSPLSLTSLVLATGGGTPCAGDNMAWINAHSKSIWLHTPLDILAQRLAQNQKRPMFKDKGEALPEIVQKLFAQRKEYYQKAHLILELADFFPKLEVSKEALPQ